MDTNVRISYAVCVHNEGRQILLPLINQFAQMNRFDDEFVFIDDFSTEPSTVEILNDLKDQGYTVVQHALNGDFASHKNFMNSQCKGKWIFNIDADEQISPSLAEYSWDLIQANPDVELFYIPRLNEVIGMTADHIKRFGWQVSQVDDLTVIQWPDYQGRLYKNSPDIIWHGKVHERIVVPNLYSHIPAEADWAIRHIKHIDRQIAQNEFYTTIS